MPSYGDYDNEKPEFDRDAEAEDILRQPPAAVGNPGATSLLDQMKAKFAQMDQAKTVYIRARNKLDIDLWIEMDIDISEGELTDFKESAKLNRASRRGAQGQARISEERFFARLLAEKTVGIFQGNPNEDGVQEFDSAGDPVDLKHDDWTASMGQPGNPVMAAIVLFGYPNLRAIAGRYLVEAGIGDEAEAVDPTHASSGV